MSRRRLSTACVCAIFEPVRPSACVFPPSRCLLLLVLMTTFGTAFGGTSEACGARSGSMPENDALGRLAGQAFSLIGRI
eukprot:1791989-Rhodomonas_salina.1